MSHIFSTQQEYQNSSFISSHKESDQMSKICHKYMKKLYNITIGYQQSHQKIKKPCKYITLTLIFLFQFLGLHQTSLAHYVEPSNLKPTISLRQVSVPLFNSQASDGYESRVGSSKSDQKYTKHMKGREKALSNLDYSPNNRGFEPKSNFRFGERTKYPINIFKIGDKSESRKDRQLNNVATKFKGDVMWSQPDPRKTYSIPIDLVGVPKQRTSNRLEFAEKLKIGEYPSRRLRLMTSASSTADVKRSSIEHSSSDLVNVIRASVAQDNQSLATPERDEEPALWRSTSQELEGDSTPEAKDAAANRRESYKQANMVTLIRYLPVLMSVPAEQVVVATAQDKPGVVVGGGALRTSSIKTGSSNQAASLDESPISSTTSTPLLASSYYRLYRPALPLKYQFSSSLPEDLSGVRQSYPATSLTEFSSTVSPNKSNFSPSSSIQASTLVGDLEMPPDFAASSLSGQYPQAGFFIQPAGSSTHETISSSLNNAKFSQLHFGNQQIAQQSGGVHSGPSKAISAYASKLISMLRPSSLLASIGPSPASSGAANSASYYPMPPMSQPQIYLLAPAETVLPQHSSRPSSSSQLVKPEDLLLNQATKLHSTTKLSSHSQQKQQYQQPQQHWNQNTDWVHQQPNGLICVHSLVQGSSKMSAQVTNQEQKQSISAASEQQHQTTTTTTNAPIFSNQQTTDVDQSSFDYIPAPSSTTEYTPIAPKQHSINLKGKQNFVQFTKESPIKLAQKLSKKLKPFQVADHNGFDSSRDSYENIQEHLGDDSGDKQTQKQQKNQHQQKQNFLGSSSESRSVIDDNQVEAKKTEELANSIKNKSPQIEQNESVRRSHDNVSSLASKKSIIPFTIKDKIDLPTRRGHHSSNRHSNISGSSIQLPLNTNNPVEYDEPSEGEIELQTYSGVGKHQRKLHRYSWPAHLANTYDKDHRQHQQDERRVKTSFISAPSSQSSSSLRPPKRKLERENLPMELNNIDYSKENSISNGRRASSLDAGYTLPLLMASSTSSKSNAHSSSGGRFASIRKQNEDSWRQKEPLQREFGELESENQERRQEAEANNEMGQPAFMRPSVVFKAPPPMTTTTTTTTYSPANNLESSTESVIVSMTEGGGPLITLSSVSANELHGLSAAASSSVTTSSTLDGQPVVLNSGRLLSQPLDNSNAKLGTGSSADFSESPPGFLLVSSSSLLGSSTTAKNNNNNINNYNYNISSTSSDKNITSGAQYKQDGPSLKRTASNQTVELLVNSSPHEQETNGLNIPSQPSRSSVSLATVRRRYSSTEEGIIDSDKEPTDKRAVNDTQVPLLLKRGLKSNQTDLEVGDKSNTRRGLENHALDASIENKAFSDFRLVSPESPAEEFSKLSESLQTNPLDLIDLQNSRSSFELPSQLESLSMLFSSPSPSSNFDSTSTFSSTSSASASSESPTDLTPIAQSKQHLSLPNSRHPHQHQHEQVSFSSNSWPTSIDNARHRRASGQNHARRLR